MRPFLVRWEIEVDAEDAHEAAAQAFEIQTDLASGRRWSSVFLVDDPERLETVTVDLAEQPPCGHSACRQHWIDTGSASCVAEDPRA